ncbi:MAG: tandem-95 repeat protein [Planctomycetes bacterium]|nr:tandem-95 repeat protein [Planctomycetota bacterium]MBL7143997.1 tandem-95 repeat protein [Phycisphaerae bacterium]
MSRTFRQYIRMVLFNKEEATAINNIEEKLKAESKARAIAEEKLRVEIETRAAAERKVEAKAQQKLLTQHHRYSALAGRIEAQAKGEIAKVKAQAKEAFEKLDSYTAELNQKDKQLKEVQEKLKAETAAKVEAQETLKAERDQHRKAEAQTKEDIAKIKALAKEKIRTYTATLNRAEEKLPKAKESRYSGENLAGAKDKGLSDKSKEQQNIDAQPIETANVLIRICRNIIHPKSKKRKVALFSVLATFSVLAIALGVSVVKNQPVAKPDSAATQEDEPVSITLMASYPDREYLTYNILKGPSYGSLSGKAPQMTYTPASNYHGQDSFTFSINEAKPGKNQATISITVLAANDVPVAYHRAETIKVNKSIAATLTGSDADGDPLTFIISKEPEHGILTFDSYFNTNGKLTYTPEPHFEGTDTFSFKLNDGKLDSAPATVSINVCPNLLPVAESHSVTTPEDTPVQIDLIGSDPDSDQLSYIMVSVTSHGSLRGEASNLTYTPDKNFNGSDSFSFKVNDGIADSAPATVSITVSSINDPPTAKGDSIVTTEDTPAVKVDVLANDTDIDNEGRNLYLDTFTVTAVTQGKNGSVTINPDSTLNYSPNANFYGSDEFTYTVRDNKGDTDTAKVNVTVNMANDAPVIISAAVTTANAGVIYTYDVNATDPDLNDTLTYSLTTKPADMTIDSATGLIEWKPTEVGENEVAVMVADSNSIPTTDTQSFTITVNPPPPKIAKIIPRDGYNHRNRKTLSADGETVLVGSSDDKRFVTSYGSYTSYDFSNESIPSDVQIKSVVVYIEHFEEEHFASGKLEWAIGTGWPRKPVVWASIEAPINEDENHEAVDSWDITSLIDTRDKLNSFQLQVKNNDIVGRNNTLIDYIYLAVEWK